MSAHTPGPWTYDEHGGCFYVWGPHGMVADHHPFPDSDVGDREPLARMRGVGRGATEAEQRANARLIAAAPRMAEILLSGWQHVSHGGPTRGEVEAVLREAGILPPSESEVRP